MLLLRDISDNCLINFLEIRNSTTSPSVGIQLFTLLSVCTRIIVDKSFKAHYTLQYANLFQLNFVLYIQYISLPKTVRMHLRVFYSYVFLTVTIYRILLFICSEKVSLLTFLPLFPEKLSWLTAFTVFICITPCLKHNVTKICQKKFRGCQIICEKCETFSPQIKSNIQ